MVGNDREESQRPGSALRETEYKNDGWVWTGEEFDRMARRVKEIELRNLTGTWAGNEESKERG
jgi:hypothetical protein